MTAVPLSVRIESVLLYLRIKWLVIPLILLVNIFESVSGLISFAQAAIVYAALLASVVPLIFLHYSLKQKKGFQALTAVSLLIDLIVIFVTIYFHGGVENSWLFFPPLVIFMAAYVFNFTAGLGYAILSYIFLVTMAYIQYHNILPSYPLFALPQVHWRNPKYLMDYLAGSFAYYMLAAFAVGSITRLAAKRAERMDEFRSKLENAKSEEDAIKERIRQSKVEILVKNAEVERLQVYSAGRQLKLIDLKRKLEELKSAR